MIFYLCCLLVSAVAVIIVPTCYAFSNLAKLQQTPRYYNKIQTRCSSSSSSPPVAQQGRAIGSKVNTPASITEMMEEVASAIKAARDDSKRVIRIEVPTILTNVVTQSIVRPVRPSVSHSDSLGHSDSQSYHNPLQPFVNHIALCVIIHILIHHLIPLPPFVNKQPIYS